MNKIHHLIPAIMALVIMVGGLCSFGLMHDFDPRGGGVCCCGCTLGDNCSTISCSGCCCGHTDVPADRRSPEIIPTSLPTITPLTFFYGEREAVRSPEKVYPEVPHRPPK